MFATKDGWNQRVPSMSANDIIGRFEVGPRAESVNAACLNEETIDVQKDPNLKVFIKN